MTADRVRPLSVSFIQQTEQDVLRQARDNGSLATSNQLLNRASDTALLLLYGLGPNLDPATAEGGYRVFAFERFGEFPYTVRAIDLLAMLGHYPEALVLIRSLLESLLQLRYFAKYKEQLKPHLLATTARERVRWVTMFDEFAPGSYVKIYGLLSGFAHSGVALSVLLPVTEATQEQPAMSLGRQGCVFNLQHAALIANFTAAVVQGFIGQFWTFFPAATPSELLEGQRRSVLELLITFVGHTTKGEKHTLLAQLAGVQSGNGPNVGT